MRGALMGRPWVKRHHLIGDALGTKGYPTVIGKLWGARQELFPRTPFRASHRAIWSVPDPST